MKMFRTILLITALMCPAQSETVDCADQQDVCECPAELNYCKFHLEIQELQTFTSYEVRNDSEHEKVTRGTAGDTYFLNETGYHSAISKEEGAFESGRCNFDTIIDFPTNCSKPITVDGSTYRMVIAINGLLPGPTLIVSENQIVRVEVLNRLTSEGVTIHWHGMHQYNTPWMDGVGFISQAPILPGGRFDYIFKAFPAGTHWYHSHVGAQRTDGLFGALVVREMNDTLDKVRTMLNSDFIDKPDEHTLTFLDWQRESSLGLFVQIHSALGFYPDKPLGAIPTRKDLLYNPRTKSIDGIEVGPVPYWSGLINGRGRNDSDTITPLSEFNVTSNTTYRFRLVGAQSLYAYKFSIDGHQLKVIATDGHLIQPQVVDFIVVHTGERYDFLLNTTNKIADNYWIRAETLEVLADDRDHTAYGVLHYETAATLNFLNGYRNVQTNPIQCSETKQCLTLNCPFLNFPQTMFTTCVHIHELRALLPQQDEKKLPKNDTQSVKFFNFGFEGDSTTSAINGKNFQLPATPYQTYCDQYESDLQNSHANTCEMCTVKNNAPSLDCTCTQVARIAQNSTYSQDEEPESIMFVISAVGIEDLRNFSHPVHLHGHSFYVVHIQHGNYTDDGILSENSPDVVCERNNELDKVCLDPTWKDDIRPSILDTYVDANGRFRSTLPRKDTIIVPAGGYVVIAFQADNPGYWFMHCHMEVHQLEGMGVLIEEYPAAQHRSPPTDINRVGDFRWTIEGFNNVLKIAKTCKNNGGHNGGLKTGDKIGITFSFSFILGILIGVACSFFIWYCCRERRNDYRLF